MKNFLLSSLFLLIVASMFGQVSRVDSLEISLKSLHGKRRVWALNELSRLLVPTDAKKAESLANEAQRFAIAYSDKAGLATAFDCLGEIYFSREEYLKALDTYHKSLEIRLQTDDEIGQANSKMQLGNIVFYLSDYIQAEKELEEALELYKKNGKLIGAAQSHDLLGQVFAAKHEFTLARRHFAAALDYWGEQNNLESAEKSAAFAGNTAYQLGDLLDAQKQYQLAIEYAELNKNLASTAKYELELARILLEQNQLQAAKNANQKSYSYNLKLANLPGMTTNNLVFGEIALAEGDGEAALQFFQKSEQLLQNQQDKKSQIEILKRLSSAYIQMGDLKSASITTKNELDFEHQLAASELANFRKIRHQLLSDRLDVSVQQERILQLEKVRSNDRKVRALMFVLMGFAGLLAAIVYVFYRKNLKDNEQLQFQNEEILQQKACYDEINKELGIKNLSLEMLNKKLVEEIAERESIERSSFARDRFLATMSHEMRSPLNVITGLTHLLLENNPRQDQTEQLRTLQFSANELVVFINEVLDFSKIEAGKLDLQSREFDLCLTSENLFQSFEKKAKAKNLLFYCSFDDQIPRKLLGDESRFYQILSNLLNNCFDHTDAGMIRAEIFLEEQKEREVVVRLIVESTDGGLERNTKLSNLETWRDENKRSESLDSQQLSLAITKRLVELQQGRLEIQNVYGEATRFTVLMPFKKAISLKNNIIQLDLNDHSHLRGSHILLVEDNKINQLVVAKMLSKYGIAVITADNGFEALEQVELHDFDLILMDIQMPEMDGYRATSEIRNHASPSKQSIPIIALTSSAFLTEKEKAVLFGMNDYVGKPFSPEELLEKISACLVPKH
ncbi:MAG: response regulator [Bacteroidetes bacterium]|nr:response regulator [Bacteroidota bacterium]